MTAGPGATADPSELELVTRTFDARRELVVRLWIEPEHLAHLGSSKAGLNQSVRATRSVKAISALWSGSRPIWRHAEPNGHDARE